MTGFDFVWSKLPGSPGPVPVDHILPKLREMQGRLIAVDITLQELGDNVLFLHTKTQLYGYERTIMDSLDYSVAAAATKSNESITKFIDKASGLETAINAFVDGMLGKGIVGSDILVSLLKAKDVIKNKFKRRCTRKRTFFVNF